MNTTYSNTPDNILEDEIQQQYTTEMEIIEHEHVIDHVKPFNADIETHDFPY